MSKLLAVRAATTQSSGDAPIIRRALRQLKVHFQCANGVVSFAKQQSSTRLTVRRIFLTQGWLFCHALSIVYRQYCQTIVQENGLLSQGCPDWCSFPVMGHTLMENRDGLIVKAQVSDAKCQIKQYQMIDLVVINYKINSLLGTDR